MCANKKILLDIGHGGKESGAVNSHSREADLNLIVGLEVDRLLKNQGFITMLSRNANVDVTLDNRCQTANNWKADLFVSIHHNAYDGKADGYGIECSIHGGVGRELAGYIATEFEKIGQNKAMGVYSREHPTMKGKDYLKTIRDTTMPAITTEFCFMDSPDFSIVDTLDEQRLEARAIFNAILKLYEFEWAIAKNVYYKTMSTPTYWEQNAIAGGTCKGEYVKQYIANVAYLLKSKEG